MYSSVLALYSFILDAFSNSVMIFWYSWSISLGSSSHIFYINFLRNTFGINSHLLKIDYESFGLKK